MSSRPRYLERRLDAELARSALKLSVLPALVGVEHEFQVVDETQQIDFRTVIGGLDLGVPGLDPTDAFAYRLPSGCVATCDGMEAEIATPPEPIRPGFSPRVSVRARHASEHLLAMLPQTWELRGYSTHVSVSAPDELAHDVAVRLAVTVAPALMLATSAPDTPGLMVRPRSGRIELGFDFVPEPWLPAAITLVAGGVRHLIRYARLRRASPLAALNIDVVPANHRYGWYVDRSAAGHDLNEWGRGTPMEQLTGEPCTAQDVLARTWATVRPDVEAVADDHELAAVDELVDGRRPIRLDAPLWRPAHGTDPTIAPSAFGEMLATRARRGYDLAPVMATWDVNVFVVVTRSRRRRVFVAVPRDDLAPFLERLDAGALDSALRGALRRGCGRSRLDSPESAQRIGLFAALGPRLALLPRGVVC